MALSEQRKAYLKIKRRLDKEDNDRRGQETHQDGIRAQGINWID